MAKKKKQKIAALFISPKQKTYASNNKIELYHVYIHKIKYYSGTEHICSYF